MHVLILQLKRIKGRQLFGTVIFGVTVHPPVRSSVRRYRSRCVPAKRKEISCVCRQCDKKETTPPSATCEIPLPELFLAAAHGRLHHSLRLKGIRPSPTRAQAPLLIIAVVGGGGGGA
jgi:hypothetical protein